MGLPLGIAEESGSAALKRADRDIGLIALDSIVTQTGLSRRGENAPNTTKNEYLQPSNNIGN